MYNLFVEILVVTFSFSTVLFYHKVRSLRRKHWGFNETRSV